jgi:hypothetical protein
MNATLSKKEAAQESSLVYLIIPRYKETSLRHIATEKCNLQNKSDYAECPFA